MFFVPFHDFYPELAEAETRHAILMEPTNGLPADTYAAVEFYCNESGCDCRRVMLMVVAKKRGPLAVISYGWESLAFYERWLKSAPIADAGDLKGPILNPSSQQSRYATRLLSMVDALMLDDPAYVERLKRHYQMVRDAVGGKARRASESAIRGRRDTAERRRVLAGKMRELKFRRSQKKRPAR